MAAFHAFDTVRDMFSRGKAQSQSSTAYNSGVHWKLRPQERLLPPNTALHSYALAYCIAHCGCRKQRIYELELVF